MSDFEEKLNAILSSPETMAQVASIAQSLNTASGGGGSGADPAEGVAAPSPVPDLSGLLGQIDPGMLSRLLPLLQEWKSGGGSGEREQLLQALRPFLKESRQAKIDRALQIARLLHIGKKLLGTFGES